MKAKISLRKAIADPQLLAGALAGESWSAWRILLIAAMGEELTDAERATFAKLTGPRTRAPAADRRGGIRGWPTRWQEQGYGHVGGIS
jgi:hypothetical protein